MVGTEESKVEEKNGIPRIWKTNFNSHIQAFSHLKQGYVDIF